MHLEGDGQNAGRLRQQDLEQNKLQIPRLRSAFKKYNYYFNIISNNSACSCAMPYDFRGSQLCGCALALDNAIRPKPDVLNKPATTG